MSKRVYKTRYMRRTDLREVREIEKECFEHPWSLVEFENLLNRTGYACSVITVNGAIIGYVVIRIEKPMTEILNFAIRPALQRNGIGRSVMRELQKHMHEALCDRIAVEVSEENLAAQQFFKACDFHAVKVLRGYYPKTGGDAYRMVYRPAALLTNPANRISSFIRG